MEFAGIDRHVLAVRRIDESCCAEILAELSLAVATRYSERISAHLGRELNSDVTETANTYDTNTLALKVPLVARELVEWRSHRKPSAH